MSKTAHTPGPWSIRGVSMETGSISVGSEQQRIVIADVTNAASFGDFISAAMKGRRDFGAPDTAETQWANARLIAAAPDLLEALNLAAQSAGFQYMLAETRDKIDAALSKATGGAS